MNTSWLRVTAPFAAFRYFQAGVYRSTSPVIPHSAAWGLILNLAGIDIRINADEATTQIDPAAPKLKIAIGAVSYGERVTLFQQLHTYPVGASGKEFAHRAKGNKYWIAPVKRELLNGLDCMIAVQSEEPDLLKRIKLGIKGELNESRYGLPFAGDNNLLFDDIQVLDAPEPCYWYSPVNSDAVPVSNSCRLSVKIDRLDSSKSISHLFAPGKQMLSEPPSTAWVWTPESPQ